VVLCTVIEMMASLFASDLVTTGGASMSCGSWRAACDTLSRTSLAAASRSTPRSNSTVMVLTPRLLAEESVRIPAMPLIVFSSGSVICDSTTSALAPYSWCAR
jgi:hypothetical protein